MQPVSRRYGVRVCGALFWLVAAALGADDEQRIRRVEQGLLPTRALQSQPWTPQRLADRMDFHKVPGVGIAVIRDSRIEWERGYGVVEAGGSRRITTGTLFQAGSISKPVAAVAALRLVERGLLHLDEDANRYLRSWKIPAGGNWQPRVTIRQLVSHTAGLTVHGFPGYPRDGPIASLVEVLNGGGRANTPPVTVNAIPGTMFRYSGGGYSVLQQLLIDVTGKPFPALMKELVLGPLGAHSTYEQPLPSSLWAVAATGHRAGGKPVAGKWHVYPEMAAAGLWTTPGDLARFAIEIQLALAGKSEKLLSQKMTRELLTRRMDDVGLGLFLSGVDKSARFGHGGWDEGFVSEMVAYQQGGLGAVVMSNADVGGSGINPEILRSIAREYAWPDYLPKERVPAAVAEVAAADHDGTYELRPGVQMVVRRERGRLLLEISGQPPLELHAGADNLYFLKEVNAEVQFTMKDGRATGLSFRQGGREMTAVRVGPSSQAGR